jgi:hypothetical protein
MTQFKFIFEFPELIVVFISLAIYSLDNDEPYQYLEYIDFSLKQ